jgi:hypothetical protein
MISTIQYGVEPVQYEYVGGAVGYQPEAREAEITPSGAYEEENDQYSTKNIAGEWTYRSIHHLHYPATTVIGRHGNSQTHISPPLTPRGSRDAHSETEVPPEITFHNYLRAFCHFHPTSTVSSTGDESSITVPINQGDVILVHSVHPNGWADGTLLTSGARGWLPTNYCEPFEPAEIRNLLNSLTNLWDMVRSTEHESLLVFSRHDYVRGMIAGVRFFLVSMKPSLKDCTNQSFPGANVLSFKRFGFDS